MKKTLIISILLILITPLLAILSDYEEIKSHINTLTSKKMQGRKAGTDGEKYAAHYISTKFRQYGLLPTFGDTFYQDFEFISGVQAGTNNNLKIIYDEGGKFTEKSLTYEKDFLPLAISKSAKVKGSLVFVGYGITAPELNYDDYSGLDTENKIAIILTHYPKEKDEKNPFKNLHNINYGDVQYKIYNANNHKAAAVILINDFANHQQQEDELIQLKEFTLYGSASIPAIHLKRKGIIPFLEKINFNIAEAEKKIEEDMQPQSKILSDLEAEISVDLIKKKSIATNVSGIIKGKSNNYILIGAHYDHLGGIESKTNNELDYYPGADDNASGVAGLVYLANKFAKDGNYDSSIIFTAFSAEEIGVQGSNYFINSGTIPTASIKAMINMDMIGRLKDSLIIGGSETAEEFKTLINRLHNNNLRIKYSADGYGPSDHSVFYNKNIPVLFFFTGAHIDHHTTNDIADKINIEGIMKVADLIYTIVNNIEKDDVKLTFHRVKESKPLDMTRRGIKTYLGTIPDFAYDGEGVKISGVREGSPASAAGLKEGDIIIRLGDKKISNLNDYTFALRSYNPGDNVKIIFIRESEEKETEATLGKR